VEIDLWCRSPSAYSCICLSSNHGGEWKKGGGRPQDCYLIKHYLMDFLIGQLIQSLLKSSLIEEPICGVGGLDLPTRGFFVLQLPTLSCQ
jgi:hypothetical protein